MSDDVEVVEDNEPIATIKADILGGAVVVTMMMEDAYVQRLFDSYEENTETAHGLGVEVLTAIVKAAYMAGALETTNVETDSG